MSKDSTKSSIVNHPVENLYIPKEDIELIQNVPILDVIEKYIPLTKNGAGYKAPCPFHQEKTPSFTVNPARGNFHCFGCHAGGDGISFVMKKQGLDFPQACREIAKAHHIIIHEKPMTEQETAEQKKKEAIFIVNTWAQKWFSEQLFKSENTLALDYLKSRWNDESIFNFNIGFAPEGWNNLQNAAKKAGYQKELLIDAGLVSTSEKEGKISTFDYFRNRIIFPIQNRSGRICGFSSRVWSGNEDKIKYLNTRETVAYKKSSILYGFHTAYRSIKEQQNAYLVEGYADVIRLQQLGIYNCVATCGTALSQQQISELKKITTTITIIGDSDPNQSGQKAVKHSAENIIQAAIHCKIISLPQGAEKHDPDSFFQSKELFIDYEKYKKQDYIFSLADIAKTDQSEPEKMVLHIEKISSLVTCLPVATQEHYFEKLQKIIPIKTKWSKKSSQAINNKNVGGSVSKSLGSEKTKHDHDFYSIEKDREGQYKGIKIDRVRVIQKLKEDGFIRYDIGIDSCRFIKIINNTLTEVSSTTIIDHFVSFIENITEFQKEWEGGSKLITSDIIKKKIFDGIDSYFSLTLLKRLTPEKPVTIKKDTQHEKFLFYQNGYVSVSNGGYSFHEYPDLDGYIWSNQILQRNFISDFKSGDQTSIYEKFIRNICNNDPDRFLSMQTIIGYSLHNFVDCKLFAIILTDSRMSLDGEANGRTGKTLWGKALGQMLNADALSSVFIEISGKDFKPNDKFKFEDGKLDTQLIHINDMKNGYNIDDSFNDITECVKVNPKNEKPFIIRPKLIFSTNKTIIIAGESAIDRVIQFEFSDYYNSTFNPSIEFGKKNEDGTIEKHWFFKDWDEQQWARFDLFMIECITKYFIHGLIKPDEINLSKRTLVDHTCQEFIDFMLDAMSESGVDYTLKENDIDIDIRFQIKSSIQFTKKEAYTAFIKLNSDYDTQQFKQKNFTKWVRMYAKYKSIPYEEDRSNGKDYFIFNWF